MLGWEKRRDQLLKEFETHIENETRDNIDRGMSPTDARQAAHRKFGNVPLAVEQSREALGGLWLERLGPKIRHPLPRPEQLGDISLQENTFGTPADAHAISYTLLDQLNRGNRSFSGIAGYNNMVRPVTAPDGTRISVVSGVAPNLFE